MDKLLNIEPSFGNWTRVMVRFFGFLVRRDDAADYILQAGAPQPEGRKNASQHV
jgi:hypothetical protein